MKTSEMLLLIACGFVGGALLGYAWRNQDIEKYKTQLQYEQRFNAQLQRSTNYFQNENERVTQTNLNLREEIRQM